MAEEKEGQVMEGAEGEAGAAEPANLLDTIVQEGKMAKDESQKEHARNLVSEFAHQVLDEGMTVSADTMAMINARIAQIDELISRQLNEIMHHPDFQKLESTWRGMHYLVMNSETSTQLKLRVLNITQKELLKDLERAVEFDQSNLFKKIYEEEYGTFGGHPFSVLVGDFSLGRHPQDVALMEKMSNVAAAAHAPFIASSDPKMLDMASWLDLDKPRDLAKIFESTEMIKWRSFRDSEDSRYFALLLPRFLLRLPYGPDTIPVEDFNYVEDVDGTDHSKYLWGNPSWALAERITKAFALYGWTAAIRGVEGGGKVEGMPVHTFKTDDGEILMKCPTEINITDRREKELNDLGFIALIHCKDTDYAAFFGGQTTQKPKKYDLDAANANAQLSARLPYILAASRFAHYIKAIMREKIGSFLTADDVSSYLNRWIGNYVISRDDADQVLKSKYPLREANVQVTEIPGKPGSYKAVVFLRPHLQLEELSTSIRLVAEIPAGG